MKLAVEINSFEPKRSVGVGSAWLSSAFPLDCNPQSWKKLKEGWRVQPIAKYSMCSCIMLHHLHQKFKMEPETECLEENLKFENHHESFSGSVFTSAGLHSLRARTRTGCSPCVEGTWVSHWDASVGFEEQRFQGPTQCSKQVKHLWHLKWTRLIDDLPSFLGI